MPAFPRRAKATRKAKASRRPAASAETCEDHPSCIRFYRPDGAINEAGWWDAQWRQNAWHVRGPSPAEAGFPTLGAPIEKTLVPDPEGDPMAPLLPYVGDEALRAAIDIFPPSG